LSGPAVEVTALPPLGASAPVATADAIPDSPKPASETVQAAPPPQATPIIPPEAKSLAQIACEKRKGRFVSLGRSGAMACQFLTRDSGKQCRRESDCDGACLARSGTCSPVKPLLGCNLILQNDGRQVELCID
jgi:hypothetical protein